MKGGFRLEFIQVTAENLEREHICCAISSSKDCQVVSKKSWLAERFGEGLEFWKADARGKCFIEYLPGENAWAPVEAAGLTWIDCLWVSGQLAGHGYADELLHKCFQYTRSQGRQGMAILSSDKKRPYLADPKFLEYKGFQAADQAGYFRLYWKPIDELVQPPRFLDRAKALETGDQGLVLYYTQQCPFTAKYVPLAQAAAERWGVPLRAVRLETGEQARRAPSPFTAYSLFWNGKFLTHEIQSEKRMEKLLAELKGAM